MSERPQPCYPVDRLSSAQHHAIILLRPLRRVARLASGTRDEPVEGRQGEQVVGGAHQHPGGVVERACEWSTVPPRP